MRLGSERAGSDNKSSRKIDPEYWLQRLIASCLTMGISKRELLNDYYLDEIGEIIHEYNELHRIDKEEVKEVSCEDFFGF